ncbi:MAG TPA: response regulator, partial [Flavihumibacter sp.]
MEKKILLIEDNPDVRENTQEILELSGYKVITASNGREGASLAQSELPDLIICDIMMPELDGYGVLHLLGHSPETATIPFIFLTAKAEKSDMRKGMLLGADDYLTKPFDDVELLQAVEIRLHKNDLLKSRFSRNAEGLNNFLGEIRHFQELRHLAENRRTHNYRKKESIYNENTYPGGIYFLESGKAKARRINELGKEYITELYKEGDFFGYADLLQGTPYQDSVVALEDCTVSFIPKQDFFKLLESDFG